VWGLKQRLAAAAFPGSRTGELLEAIAPSFPIEVIPAESVLQIALSNMNMVVHCLTLLLNVGRVEASGGAFRFYTDGVTPTTGKLMESLDAERRQVGKAYGLELASAVEWVKAAYALEGDSLYELLSKNPAYAGHGNDAPKEVRHRYVTEDVPNLLVPLEDLARSAGIEVPVTTSLITLWNLALDEDFRSSGRRLESMGLAKLAPKEVQAVLKGGF
jgi:opine dehydrogenase